MIQNRQGQVFHNTIGLYIAEQSDFLSDRGINGLIAAGDNDIRLDTKGLQLLDGMLSGLGFMLAGALDIWNQGNMDKQAVFAAHLMRNLPDRFQKRLALNIAGGAADFGNDHIGIGLFAHRIDKGFDLVGDMGITWTVSPRYSPRRSF